MNETKVEKNDFKGNKNFKPVVNMGVKKARALVKHIKELEHFVARTK